MQLEKNASPELLKTRVAIRLSRGLQLRTIGQLLDDNRILYNEPTLIFPASFGGLDGGMLSADHVAQADVRLDVADQPGYEPRDDRLARRRLVLQRGAGGWKYFPYKLERSDSPGLQAIFDEGNDDLSRSEISKRLRRPPFTLRTVEIIKFSHGEEGEPQKLLLLLSGISPGAKGDIQALSDHVKAVECEAKRIAQSIGLSPGDRVHEALTFAAKWHDHGKDTPTWQRFIGGPMEGGVPLGKSDRYCDPRKLGGYRHEFGSLLRLLHPDPKMAAQPNLPVDQTTQDLALHLIAVHHGFGRPHFDSPIDRDFHDPDKIDAVHAECLRRFARLQRKYGWWHLAWLERLALADQVASAEVGNEEIQEDETEPNR